MVQDSASRKQDQFVLRLPDGMRARISAVAKANKRSMNAEVVARLEESRCNVALSPDSAAALAELKVELKRMAEDLAKIVSRSVKRTDDDVD